MLLKRHVWLAHAPHGVCHFVWLAVCMAALAAIDSGNRYLFALSARRREEAADRVLSGTAGVRVVSSGGVRRPVVVPMHTLRTLWGMAEAPSAGQLPAPSPTPPPSLAVEVAPDRAAALHAVATFWESLVDIAAVGVKGWHDVGLDHPFLCVPVGETRLRLRRSGTHTT